MVQCVMRQTGPGSIGSDPVAPGIKRLLRLKSMKIS